MKMPSKLDLIRIIKQQSFTILILKRKKHLSHSKFKHYTEKQKRSIINIVEKYSSFLPKSRILRLLDVTPTTYYSWARYPHIFRPASPMRLTPNEKESIIKHKLNNIDDSFRTIAGYLREKDIWVSNSSCYRVLKEKGLVGPYMWNDPVGRNTKYEAFRKHQLWGFDWTAIWIDRVYWNLLTVLDYFSRKIVSWNVVQYVSSHEIQKLLWGAYKNENLKETDKPKLRFDQHASNISNETLDYMEKLGFEVSPSRVRRPTDNPRQERWYLTLKKADVKIRYDNVEQARDIISKFVSFYNSKRPHQALFSFPPDYIHEINNKSIIYDYYKQKLIKSRKKRLDYYLNQN